MPAKRRAKPARGLRLGVGKGRPPASPPPPPIIETIGNVIGRSLRDDPRQGVVWARRIRDCDGSPAWRGEVLERLIRHADDLLPPKLRPEFVAAATDALTATDSLRACAALAAMTDRT